MEPFQQPGTPGHVPAPGQGPGPGEDRQRALMEALDCGQRQMQALSAPKEDLVPQPPANAEGVINQTAAWVASISPALLALSKAAGLCGVDDAGQLKPLGTNERYEVVGALAQASQALSTGMDCAALFRDHSVQMLRHASHVTDQSIARTRQLTDAHRAQTMLMKIAVDDTNRQLDLVDLCRRLMTGEIRNEEAAIKLKKHLETIRCEQESVQMLAYRNHANTFIERISTSSLEVARAKPVLPASPRESHPQQGKPARDNPGHPLA